MKFGTVDVGQAARPVCWIDEARLLDLACRENSSFTLTEFIGLGEEAWHAARARAQRQDLPAEAVLALREARLLAPIPRPTKNVFCVGRNYAEHIQEDNVSRDKDTDIPKVPQFFTKPPTSVVGPDEAVLLDGAATRRLDYEVELAVVIGRGGKNISADGAMGYVFGYTIVNDVSARDLQARHDQWFKGKALDGTCPMGPWIVTADKIPDPHTLQISLSVNGEPRQNASTGAMIFQIPQLIESLSKGLTIEPGDIIATGTPSGVGYAMNPRQWLADGDEIVCEIEKIGRMANRVRAV